MRKLRIKLVFIKAPCHSGLPRIDSGCVRRLTYQNDGGRDDDFDFIIYI